MVWIACLVLGVVVRIFFDQLERLQPVQAGRKWAFVPYDQLSDGLGLLSQSDPDEVGIVLVETSWKPGRRAYHKQKLALLLSAQRHFALEQAKRGVAVRYVVGERGYAALLKPVIDELGPMVVMLPAERELRENLRPLIECKALQVIDHDGWMTTTEDFHSAMRDKRAWRMDIFYRYIRKRYAWLLDTDGKPVGGKWSHDADNRRPWTGDPPAPKPPRFVVDDITQEVVELVESRFGHHPGTLSPECIPATIDDVETVWQWTLGECMNHFGPYEDAMSVQSVQLFHGRLSGLMNLHRLLPARVVSDVLELDIPINSKEGFIRQVVGWREFVRHVHQETDGFRRVPVGIASGLRPSVGSDGPLQTEMDLPEAYWNGQSGYNCLDHVVREVWSEGYTHHINRLMVLANWGTLLGVAPEQLSDWFWVAFEDAYDWVVEPNVLGMGTYAVGDLMVTKPYVSGSAYIHKMSDYCDGCSFHPKKTCPMTALYWDFLRRNKDALASNPRMRIVMASLARRSPERIQEDEAVTNRVRDGLRRDETMNPVRLYPVFEKMP